jgi:tRNA threonylcarbamoyladenosine biosynthesis protein TsaE
MPESNTPEQTERIAGELARTLRAGDVVLVSGELGTGKTTFVRGACRELGVPGPVTSPTFTIARRYEGGRVPVSHLDLYRLADAVSEDPALLDDEIAPERVTFVEWPEVGSAPLAGARIAARVRLEHRGTERRAITIERAA